MKFLQTSSIRERVHIKLSPMSTLLGFVFLSLLVSSPLVSSSQALRSSSSPHSSSPPPPIDDSPSKLPSSGRSMTGVPAPMSPPPATGTLSTLADFEFATVTAPPDFSVSAGDHIALESIGDPALFDLSRTKRPWK